MYPHFPLVNIKVLIVTGIFPPDIGGPATYVPAIGRELVKRGHKVTVVTLSDAPHQRDRSYRFRVVRLPRNVFKPLRLILTVATILRLGRQAHVIFVNGLYLEAGLANLFLGKRLVQKIVGDWAWERATNKGWIKDDFEEFQKRRYSRKIEALKTLRSFCTRRADATITPSHYLARWVVSWGQPEQRIAVIYNAIESRAFPTAPVPLSTRVTIVTVGRLVPWKRVDHLIEALADCAEAGLVIIGDGPERGRLEQLVRARSLSGRVYFAGQRNKQETFSLMAACDLFVLNSTYEGFPHVALEAMSAGLPVVATAVGGTPEIVRNGENGVLVPPRANGELSEALSRLVSSPSERERLATEAKRTLEGFRLSVMVEQTEAALQGVQWLRAGGPQANYSASGDWVKNGN